MGLLGVAGAASAKAPVAIFSEPEFPCYIASAAVTPEFVRYCLAEAGIESDYVSAAQLADPQAFNAERYRVLAYVYGNTFPMAALENLRRFHASRGCIVAFGGVPFCHPCVFENGKWVDKIDQYGWEFVSHRKMGTGLWGEAADVGGVAYAPGEPLGLSWMPLPVQQGTVQFPRLGMTPAEEAGTGYDHPLGLPPEDVAVPIASVLKHGQPVGSPICIIEHHCPEFRGSTDIWAGTTMQASLSIQQQQQLVVACCAYLLERAGLMTAAQRAAILERTRADFATPAQRTEKAAGQFILRAPAPARQLVVMDATRLSADEKLLAMTLQGVVNRKQPRVYLTGEFKDAKWLGVIREYGHKTVDCPSLDALVDMFRGELAGCVVYDPAQPHTINVATMLAGLDRAPVATPELATRYHLKIVDDLRGRFADPMAGYEWALRTLWPRLQHRAIACMAPSWVAPRDYLVQFPMFTFWFDCQVSKPLSAHQGLFFERLLSKMEPHGAVYGWWQDGDDGGIGEGRGVTTSSQYAQITVCTVGAYNLSVHSGMPMPGPLRQKPIKYGSLDKKAYITFIVSDGDNFSMNLYPILGRFWEQKMRGKVPVGWGICPTQVELTPAPVRYWYQTATENDLFVAMDGLGYIYPDQYGAARGNATALCEGFYHWSGQFMRALDQRHLWFLGGTSRAPQMARVLPLDGLFCEYGVADKPRQEILGQTAAFWADVNPWEKPWDDVETYVKRIRARTPTDRPAFLFAGVNGFCIGPNEIARILQRLGPDYVAVRPDELCYLYRKFKTSGTDANPAPRPPLDLALPPAPGPQTKPDGTIIVQEDDDDPDLGGWFTDPTGTSWVRKRLTVSVPATAKEARVRALVAGEKGRRVVFRVNGHEHVAPLCTSGWTWVEVSFPASELVSGENEIWYTGNPDARMFTAGDGSTNLGHSDYGGPGAWSALDGELMCRLEVR
jgi:hypothetical protein